MTDLADAVDSLKNALAVPGTFADIFPDTTDDDLAAVLLDGFAEAQLYGFFSTYTATDEAVVTPNLTRREMSLIVLYTTVRVLRAELKNRKTHVRYEASGTVFEQDTAVGLLVALLKTYEDEKKTVTKAGVTSGAGTAFYMADQYLERQYSAFGSFVVSEPYAGWN